MSQVKQTQKRKTDDSKISIQSKKLKETIVKKPKTDQLQRKLTLLEDGKVENEEPLQPQSLNEQTKLNFAIHRDLDTEKPLDEPSEQHRNISLLSECINAKKSSITQTSNSSKLTGYSGNDFDSIKVFAVINH